MSTLRVNTIQDTAGTDLFTSSETASGYQKLPGGLIIQWGTGSAGAAVTFPLAFPTAALNAIVTPQSTSNTSGDISPAQFNVATLTTTGFTRTNQTFGCRYIAIGY